MLFLINFVPMGNMKKDVALAVDATTATALYKVPNVDRYTNFTLTIEMIALTFPAGQDDLVARVMISHDDTDADYGFVSPHTMTFAADAGTNVHDFILTDRRAVSNIAVEVNPGNADGGTFNIKFTTNS